MRHCNLIKHYNNAIHQDAIEIHTKKMCDTFGYAFLLKAVQRFKFCVYLTLMSFENQQIKPTSKRCGLV